MMLACKSVTISANEFHTLQLHEKLLFQVNLDLVTLALYDIVIWADDSTSMQALDHGERIEDLKAILGRVADAATLFDDDGKRLYLSRSSASTYYVIEERAAPWSRQLQSESQALTKWWNVGISVRFMNSPVQGDHLKSAADVRNIISRVKFEGASWQHCQVA